MAQNNGGTQPQAMSRRRKKDSLGENRILVGGIDYILLITVVLLVIFGIIMVFSSSYYTTGSSANYGNDMYYYLKRNVAFAVIGFMCMIFMSKFPFEKLKNISFHLYAATILMLIWVLFFGKEVNGAKRWIGIGSFTFQPSEIAKSTLILFLSTYIVQHKNILKSFVGFLRCALIIAIPMGLVALQNLSTALVLAAIGFGILFVASPKLWHFTPIAVGGVLGVFAMIFGSEFRSERMEAWKNPFSDPQGVGYQTIQSLYAIASGGFWGLGLGQSRQKLGYIPEGHNDIIFAIICEELGLFGAILLMGLFMILIWRGVRIATKCVSTFGALVASGITIMITVQVIINIAVVTNTIPNTGIPLPFISYGGTSLVFMLVSMGILLNISRYYKE